MLFSRIQVNSAKTSEINEESIKFKFRNSAENMAEFENFLKPMDSIQ